MKQLDLIKRIRDRTLEKILKEHGMLKQKTNELREMKLSIWDVRCILYEICNEEAKWLFDEEFRK